MGQFPDQPEAPFALGIDVGGTKVAGGLVSFPDGKVRLRQVIPTLPERGAQAVLDDVIALAAGLRQQALAAGWPVRGVGVGVPELVDPQGRLTSGATIDWRSVSLAERLGFCGAVHVEADVRAAARAEAVWGAGRPYRVFAYVTVGTGISSALVQDGVPFPGARGNALVLGSGTYRQTCPHCDQVFEHVLEDVASGAALAKQGAGGEGLLAAADAGDPEAGRVVRSAGEALGNAVAFLVNVLDPEAVVVGGGLGLAGGVYWDSFVTATRRAVWAAATRDLPLVPAALGVDAGIIGAAALVAQAGA